MSPVYSPRRRADEFDALVEGRARGAGPRHEELLELVGALRGLPEVTPRPDFVADLRVRLMAEAPTALAEAGPSLSLGSDRLTVPERRVRRERRIAAAVGGFAVVGATTSMAVASQSALPGDVLYPVKRAIENAHTGLSADDQQKGQTLLANASDRLQEVEELSQRVVEAEDAQDVRAIEDTLASFGDQAAEASDLLLADYAASGDEQAIRELQDFTAESFDALTALAGVVPEPATDALVSAGNVLAGIEAEIMAVCPTCEARLHEIPQWLLAQAGTLGEGLLAPGAATDGSPDIAGDGAATAGDDPAEGRPGDGRKGQQEVPSLDGSLAGLVEGESPADGGTGSSGSGSGGADAPEPRDPVDGLLDTLTGGIDGSKSGGKSKPGNSTATQMPALGDVLGGAGDGVTGLLGQTPSPR